MYYSHPCTYCTKLFYTYNANKEQAAQDLYEGIKRHLIYYDEDHKEYEMDEDPKIEKNQMYAAMKESSSKPAGGYDVRYV